MKKRVKAWAGIIDMGKGEHIPVWDRSSQMMSVFKTRKMARAAFQRFYRCTIEVVVREIEPPIKSKRERRYAR